MEKGTRRTLSIVLAIVLLSAWSSLPAAEKAPAAGGLQLDGAFSAAAGQSASDSFLLSACLCGEIGGIASSQSFRIMAGCVALVPGWPDQGSKSLSRPPVSHGQQGVHAAAGAHEKCAATEQPPLRRQ